MRVSISPSGSTMLISLSSPARLNEAGDQAFVPQFAERDTGHLHLAVHRTRTARDFATQFDACLRRVARQGSQLEARFEALLNRLRLVVGNRLQRGALCGEA